MAMQEGSTLPTPSAQVVGNAFVEQYYHILHKSPELVHRFYQDSSFLSRPDNNGSMMTVTTMQAINEKILSLKFEDYTAEIKTADAQESFEKGVIVLVTGLLTGKDNVRKKFSQTFFLAPQDKGYFVLNDVFRYVEESNSPDEPVSINGIIEDAPPASASQPEAVEDHVVAETVNYPEEEDLNDDAEVCDPSDKEEESVVEDEVIKHQIAASQSETLTVVDSSPAAYEDAPKKSYASIVKVMKSNAAPSLYVPTNKVRAVPAEQQAVGSAKPAAIPEVSAPEDDAPPESSDVPEEAEGYSIYVRNLPYNATSAQLEEVFKKFGSIKRNGIQVRSNKQGFTFGFVEFEALSSMQSALEASPITIGDRQAVVEEKRTNTRVGGGGRGRYSSGKGGFRSDSFRGRGNFGGGRGYGRNEFRNPGEFSGRPKGSSGRNGENYQRANQNGNGRGGRQGGAKP